MIQKIEINKISYRIIKALDIVGINWNKKKRDYLYNFAI